MSYRSVLRRIIFPPRCAVCRELLPFDAQNDDVVLCPDCRGEWEREKLRKCPECGRAMIDCGCMPDNLRNAGCAALFRLAEYDAENFYGAVNSIVNNLKRTDDRDDFTFFANQMARSLILKLKKYAVDAEDVIVTYAPRSRGAISVYGFDQSERLARELAKAMGAEFERLLVRRRRLFDRRQKKLDAYGREKNARRAITRCRKDIDIRGRAIIVIDDVITTGATTSVCVEILRSMGAGTVFCSCIARAGSLDN